MLLSIVVPVYNSENYVINFGKSLNKICTKLDLVEIIFINDCSLDNSLSSLKKIQLKNKNIFLINNNQNFGPSYSRYIGISASRGKYIFCCDIDDEIIPSNFLKVLKILGKVQEKDIFFFDFYKKKNSLTLIKNEASLDNFIIKKNVQLHNYFSFIFLRKKIQKNFFLKHIFQFEDGLFFYSFLPLVKRYMYINLPFYIYKINKGSLTTKFNVHWLTDRSKAVNQIIKNWKSNGYENKSLMRLIKINIFNDIMFSTLLLSNFKHFYALSKEANLQLYIKDFCIFLISDLNFFCKKKYKVIFSIILKNFYLNRFFRFVYKLF